MLTAGDELLRATAKAAFWQNFEAYPTVREGITAEIASDADQETYPWLAYAPGVREMGGDRVKRSVPQIDWVVKNRKFENTVVVEYKLRRFGKLGAVANLVGNLGAKARAYPDELLSIAIRDGHSTACYDGQNFFDTDHVDPEAKYTTAQDNDLTGAIVAAATPTDIEFADAVGTVIDTMYGYKDGDGDPVFPSINTDWIVMVPPGYRRVAKRVELVDQLTGPVGNDLKGMYRTVVNPWLNAPGTEATFFVFNASGVRKPFIHQVADPITIDDDMDSVSEFMSKDVAFGSFGFYNVSYGDWRYACKYVFTTA